MAAARRALVRNKGKDWASASGAVRARYLRAIAAKVGICFLLLFLLYAFLFDSPNCRCLEPIVYFGLQITERKSELAKLETLDAGKPIDEASWDMVTFYLGKSF